MAGEQGVDLPVEFESVLRDEMATVPSAAFLPRVRQRVAVEEMRGSKWTWRMVVPLGALAAASALAISFGGLTGSVATPPLPPRPALRTLAPIARVTPMQVDSPAGRFSGVRRFANVPVTPIRNEPLVIVDERQRAALTTVLRLVQQGRLTEGAFDRTVPASLQPIQDGVVRVGVNALVVSPIETGGVLQTETEKQKPQP